MALPLREALDRALLAVLAETGRARPRDVYPRVTQRFPGITPQDLPKPGPTAGTSGRTRSSGRGTASPTGAGWIAPSSAAGGR